MDTSDKICRICLHSGTDQEFTQIFSKNSEIALKIFLISGVRVLELTEYNIPAVICQQCLKELYQCFLFRKKCQSSDEYFKTQTSRFEEQLWELKDDTTDCKSIKFEPFEEITEEAYFQNDDQLIKTNEIQSYGSREEEILIEEPKLTRNTKSRRKNSKNDSVEPERKRKKSSSLLKCQYCGIVLSRRNRLIQHERLHILDQTKEFYECFFCGKSFNQKFGLVPHLIKLHNFKPGPQEKWKCAICENKILPPGNLALHYEKEHSSFVLNKSSQKIFEPLINKKELSLKRHQSKSSEARTPRRRGPRAPKPPSNFWPCSICGNSFTNYARYQKHLKEIHEVNEQEILQETAALNVTILSNDKTSITTQKGPKFPCSTCGKVFASSMTVRAHEKTHLNLTYTCDLCGSAFRVKAYLTAHVQKVHMKLKKFKCSIENCSASFVHRELLNYHVRKHLNIRNFACKYCNKTFVTRSCCKIHERIHTDERPYTCKFCDRTFIHHSDHRRHELKHGEPKEQHYYETFSAI